MSFRSEDEGGEWRRYSGGRGGRRERPPGILRLDIGGGAKPRRNSVEFRTPVHAEPPSPQPSIDHLSVTFAPEDRSMCSDNSVKVNLCTPDTTPTAAPPLRMTDAVLLPTPEAADGSEDEDYSASVNAVMKRRASTRKSRRRSSRRRASSPFSPDLDSLYSASRRRSSVFTTSSGETAISVDETTGSEEMYELLKLHKEVLSAVRTQPWPMRRKLRLVQTAQAYVKQHEGALQQRLAASRNTRDVVKRFRLLTNKKWQYIKREVANLSNYLTPWELRIKHIESHFGSAVASYFTFLRWLFWVNLVIAGTLIAFVTVPEVLTADWKQSGERKEMLPEEQRLTANLVTLWNFEGILKYSPLFYGYYSHTNGTGGYRLPLAYFFAGLLVYVYSFIATLRKMAKNSRMSKLSENDDECVFTWKLFTGWDFMIGNAETAQNRVSSLVLGFKEALLEEAEKKRENRNWKIIVSRIFVNLSVLVLLGFSACAVVFAVQRSTEEAAKHGWWRQNETTVVVSLITSIFPNIFEVLGFLEHYHPRKQLRMQLARIMVLNLLNLYSLTFSLFDKITDMQEELDDLKLTTSVTTMPSSFPILDSIFPAAKSEITTQISAPECEEVLVNCTELAVNVTKVVTAILLTTMSTLAVTRAEMNATFTPTYPNEPSTGFFLPDKSHQVNDSDVPLFDAGNSTFYPIYSFPEGNATFTSSHRSNQTGMNGTTSGLDLDELNGYYADQLYDPSLEEALKFILDNPAYEDLEDVDASTVPAVTENISEILAARGPPLSLPTIFDFVRKTITERYGTPGNSSRVTLHCVRKCGNSTKDFVRTEDVRNRTVLKVMTSTTTTTTTTSYPEKVLPRNTAGDSLKIRQKLRELCWETMFGQELVKLTVMDLMVTVFSTLLVDFFRALFVRYMNNCWCWDLEKKFPQYGDFKIAENILHLVNNQGLVWMGMFFSPGLALINLVKLVIMMYLRSWTVLTCNVPHEVVFRASRSNNFYFALLLTMLFLCVLPVGYAVVWLKPSWHCGPFSGYKTISEILTTILHEILPQRLHKVLDYIASPGIVIPLLVLLVLIIYYLTSLSNALREANNDLKIQLRRERTEERRKMFQIADKRYKKGSTSLDNAPYGKWKKLFTSIPPAKVQGQEPQAQVTGVSEDATTGGIAENKVENKKREIMARIMKNAFGMQSTQSEDEGTDTEFHESLLEDPKDFKPEVIAHTPKSEGLAFKFTDIKPTVAEISPKIKPAKQTSAEIKRTKFEQRPPKKRQSSEASVWSENIPVITISKTESSECILENKKNEAQSEKSSKLPSLEVFDSPSPSEGKRSFSDAIQLIDAIPVGVHTAPKRIVGSPKELAAGGHRREGVNVAKAPDSTIIHIGEGKTSPLSKHTVSIDTETSDVTKTESSSDYKE